jgi:hypothetical protein
LAVVCPGCGTAGPATGRKWHRTSLSRARRNLDRPARPGQGGAGPLGGCKSDHSQTAGGFVGTARVLATKTCRNQSRCLTAGRAKTTSVIDAITRRANLRPACRYLSLRFQTVQSCNPVHYPITTAVQPWCEQECAYTFISIEFALLRGRWRRPCVKYRFNSYTCRGLTAACRLYIQNEGLREKFCPACNNRRR